MMKTTNNDIDMLVAYNIICFIVYPLDQVTVR